MAEHERSEVATKRPWTTEHPHIGGSGGVRRAPAPAPDHAEQTAEPTPVRVRCPNGGHAPCVDDLCHGVDTTMCGLEIDIDVCPHGWLPTTCPEGCGDCDEEPF